MSLISSYSMLSLCTRCRSRLFSAPAPHFSFQLTRSYQWKKQTHYDVLGVHPEASQAEIKEAYLKLSKVSVAYSCFGRIRLVRSLDLYYHSPVFFRSCILIKTSVLTSLTGS